MFGGVSQFDMTLELSRRRIDSFIVGKKGGGARRWKFGVKYTLTGSHLCHVKYGDVTPYRIGPSAIQVLTANGLVNNRRWGKRQKADIVVVATGFKNGFLPLFPTMGENELDLNKS